MVPGNISFLDIEMNLVPNREAGRYGGFLGFSNGSREPSRIKFAGNHDRCNRGSWLDSLHVQKEDHDL